MRIEWPSYPGSYPLYLIVASNLEGFAVQTLTVKEGNDEAVAKEKVEDRIADLKAVGGGGLSKMFQIAA